MITSAENFHFEWVFDPFSNSYWCGDCVCLPWAISPVVAPRQWFDCGYAEGLGCERGQFILHSHFWNLLIYMYVFWSRRSITNFLMCISSSRFQLLEKFSPHCLVCSVLYVWILEGSKLSWAASLLTNCSESCCLLTIFQPWDVEELQKALVG